MKLVKNLDEADPLLTQLHKFYPGVFLEGTVGSMIVSVSNLSDGEKEVGKGDHDDMAMGSNVDVCQNPKIPSCKTKIGKNIKF